MFFFAFGDLTTYLIVTLIAGMAAVETIYIALSLRHYLLYFNEELKCILNKNLMIPCHVQSTVPGTE